jgi:hypothetical protein
MTDTFRALCQELIDEIDAKAYGIKSLPSSVAIDRTRAALAEPEPQGPKLVYRYSPVTIAECGGPCEQGPQYCDCGEIKGEPVPAPVAFTDEEIHDWHGRCADLTRVGEADHYWAFDLQHDDVAGVVRAALARWGRPAIEPVPVSERWPEFSDCNSFEEVWAFNPVLDHWKLTRINRSIHTHWLPHWALPVPGVEGSL